MRIGMVLPHWHEEADLAKGLPRHLGAHRMVIELSAALSREHEVTILTFGKERLSLSGVEPFQVEVFPAKKTFPFINGAANPVAFNWLKELRNFDVIHGHQVAADTVLLAILTARRMRRPAFITDYGWNGLAFGRYRTAARFANGVLLLSSFELGLYRRYNKNLAVVHCGVDSTRFTPSDNRGRERVILFVGRITPHKGIQNLIAALPPECELKIIGQTLDKRLERKLLEQAQGKNVNFLGVVDDSELIDAYREAAVCVLPSTYFDYYGRFRRSPELFGLVLAEAMACETPVVCTWVGGMPELVQHGVTGLIVPPDDVQALNLALAEILDDEQMARAMGRAGREKMKTTFTWEVVAQRCLEAYERFG